MCNSDILAFFTKIELVEKEYVREQKAAQEEYEVRAASQLWECFILFLCDYFVILFIFYSFHKYLFVQHYDLSQLEHYPLT